MTIELEAKERNGIQPSDGLRETDLKRVWRDQEDLDHQGSGLPSHQLLGGTLSVDALKQLLCSAGLTPQDVLRKNGFESER